ncbi:MAG: hypothetical protein HKN32_07775 [Flavobacteriales bacterium]|nr:hypothetical protein [Flavobacteriales bacterium]
MSISRQQNLVACQNSLIENLVGLATLWGQMVSILQPQVELVIPGTLMKNKDNSRNESASKQDIYDFSGPLWNKYFEETRKKVKFPRGYKEVNLFS